MAIAPAVLAAIIGAAATTGETIYSAVSQPSAPKAAPAAGAGPSRAQMASAAAPYGANIQAATGGSLSPEYYIQNAALQAGTAGQPGSDQAMRDMVARLFGTGGGAEVTGGLGSNTASETFRPSTQPTNEQAAFQASPGVSDFMAKMAAALS